MLFDLPHGSSTTHPQIKSLIKLQKGPKWESFKHIISGTFVFVCIRGKQLWNISTNLPFCQAQAHLLPSWPGLALISLCIINFQFLSLFKTSRKSMFPKNLYCQDQTQRSWPGLALNSLCTINFQLLGHKTTWKSICFPRIRLWILFKLSTWC